MRVIIEIPLDDYHLCMTRFPLNSPEYRMLKNGVVVRNDRDEEVVHILCEPETALAIRKLFAAGCPEAVDRIKELPENNRSWRASNFGIYWIRFPWATQDAYRTTPPQRSWTP